MQTLDQRIETNVSDKRLMLLTSCFKTMEFLLVCDVCPPFKILIFDETEYNAE